MRGEARRARDRTTLDVGEALGEECMAARGADVEDLQVKAPKEMRLSVNVLMMMLMMMKVKGLVTVLLVKVKVKVKVKVMVKVFVVEVFLSSLSSTSFRRTRPAALGLGFWG